MSFWVFHRNRHCLFRAVHCNVFWRTHAHALAVINFDNGYGYKLQFLIMCVMSRFMFYITFGVISLLIKFNTVYSNIWISYIVNDYIIRFNKFQTQCSTGLHQQVYFIDFELLHQQVYFIVKRKMFNTYNKQTIINNTLTHFSKLIIHFSIFSNFLSPSLSTIFVAVSSLSSSFFILGPHLSLITFSLHHEKKL